MSVIDRPDWRGALANALIPVSVAAITYCVLFLGGFTRNNPAFTELPFDANGWIAALVWIGLFGLYGIARWGAVIDGPEGERLSWLVVAMMVWTVFYAFIGSQLSSSIWLDAANLFSLCLGIFVASRLVRLSRRIVTWLIPAFLWKMLAVLVGLAPVVGIRLF
ncbi:hypothetical protein [Terrihabitans sp. B22-R8]|uniref:hypothetical protein n=1 Tax=Terrihabitans sp. B22-R8 TaxID=3425128 RepID=UPI00403C5962